jgi:transcription termination/antitermination protein NusG
MMNELKWYVLRAVSGQEKKVMAYLETEIQRQNLTEYLPSILIPSEKVYQIRNGKKKVRERNTLPGYVFISANLDQPEVMHVITGVPGVLGFLGDAEGKNANMTKKPVALRQAEVNRLLGSVEASNEFDVKLEVPFVVGETIKVTDGPFNGFSGSVEEVFEEKKKLNVMVKIFGRSTPVELNYMQVEKIS